MAKHRQQHVTCGHFHAKEVEAWGCLDLQDDPQDRKLLSTWLSSADMGGRWEATEVIGRMVALSFCAMFLVTGIAGIASGVMKSDLGNAFIGIIFMTAGGIPGYGVLLKVIDEIRRLPAASRDSVSAAAPIR